MSSNDKMRVVSTQAANEERTLRLNEAMIRHALTLLEKAREVDAESVRVGVIEIRMRPKSPFPVNFNCDQNLGPYLPPTQPVQPPDMFIGSDKAAEYLAKLRAELVDASAEIDKPLEEMTDEELFDATEPQEPV